MKPAPQGQIVHLMRATTTNHDQMIKLDHLTLTAELAVWMLPCALAVISEPDLMAH